MGNIVLLDEATINKIAAGEVIERPASVVKEMVENSIDAGADNITIEIKNGGISYIKITDNGKGIAEDDLEIAFERHATSKIRSADDLNTVTSMGFRGEALASIAAVSNVEIVSKPATQSAGYTVILSGGNVLGKKEIGCPNGTTITVTDLFFNTPVRYKFLKKDYTETGYIEDVVSNIALVNPNIAFKLINAGKTVIQTNGSGNIIDVIYGIYGKDIANAVLPVDYEYEGIKVKGVVGKPQIARSNRSNQIFFVNKRNIKDKALSAATAQSYKGLIPIGKFGFVILDMEMDPSKVDVNVHPAKLEVRFEEENKVFQAVYHSIKDTLLKADLVKDNVAEKQGKLSPTDIQRQMARREADFEERWAKKKKEMEKAREGHSSTGLFGLSRQSKKIEKYTDDESKIKTNIIEDVYNSKNKENEENEEALPKAFTRVKDTEESYNPEETDDTNALVDKLKEIKDEVEKSIRPEDIDINDDNLTEEQLDTLNKKVEMFLNEAEKIKEKNEQIIAGTYVPPEKPAEPEPVEEVKNNEQVEKLEQLEQNEQLASTTEEHSNSEEANNNSEIPKALQNLKKELAEEEEKEASESESKPEETLEQLKEKIEEIEEDPTVVTEEFKEMYAKLFGTVPKTEEDIKREEEEKLMQEKLSAVDIVKDNVSMFDDEEEFDMPKYKFIGIAFKTYIILEMDKELYILDQHAAHERIMYEKVKENYYRETNKDSQMLLLPDIIELTHKEMAIAKENMDMFRKAGFELEEFGENTIKLIGCPTMCLDIDTKEMFLETLDEINTVARTAKQEKEEKFIATVACKAAVKAKMALDEREVDALMMELLKLPNPFTCPHGRPTAIKMTQYDIERKFSRK